MSSSILSKKNRSHSPKKNSNEKSLEFQKRLFLEEILMKSSKEFFRSTGILLGKAHFPVGLPKFL